MTERPTCATCPYWAEREMLADMKRGDCRFGSPSYREKDRGADFPPVWAADWCGRHPDFPAYVAGLKPAEASR